VGQHPVEPDRHAEAGQQVHERQHGEIGRADDPVPEQHDGRQARQERDDHGGYVGDAGGSRHDAWTL
jgi:hypothetical protein